MTVVATVNPQYCFGLHRHIYKYACFALISLVDFRNATTATSFLEVLYPLKIIISCFIRGSRYNFVIVF